MRKKARENSPKNVVYSNKYHKGFYLSSEQVYIYIYIYRTYSLRKFFFLLYYIWTES